MTGGDRRAALGPSTPQIVFLVLLASVLWFTEPAPARLVVVLPLVAVAGWGVVRKMRRRGSGG
ncbi:hypothetical protein ACX8Z9_04860 [Arthrobacter halodurans]|uniref:PEP-CTERM protein-sorting domain-containing protein n=1 Tax=Arthrobacter halodurans TaxID=516699 RepID=A0ABV4UQ10_9MICC